MTRKDTDVKNITWRIVRVAFLWTFLLGFLLWIVQLSERFFQTTGVGSSRFEPNQALGFLIVYTTVITLTAEFCYEYMDRLTLRHAKQLWVGSVFSTTGPMLAIGGSDMTLQIAGVVTAGIGLCLLAGLAIQLNKNRSSTREIKKGHGREE